MTDQYRVAGLTVIEVLVAMAILAIASAALLGTFASIVTLNRDASRDVDYSRVVRSVVDRTKLDWEIPLEWDEGRVANVPFAQFVEARSDGACTGTFDPSTVSADVRIVTMVCAAAGDLAEQTYMVEFGRP